MLHALKGVPAYENNHAAAAVNKTGGAEGTSAVSCPSCGKLLDGAADAQRLRPFCSERCKMGDLGAWFAERYAVPAGDSKDAEAVPPLQAEDPPQRQ